MKTRWEPLNNRRQRIHPQFMTAGSGTITQHSEHNHHTDKPLCFIQTWIVPERRGLVPNYGGYDASDKVTKNKVRHLASSSKDDTSDTPVKLNQDVNCKAGELELGHSVSIDLPEGRQAYLFVC